jgi:hypothetical protein
MEHAADESPICCPKFDPSAWDDKILEWTERSFIKDHVFTLFYMPLNFGAVMRRFDKTIRAAGATNPDALYLSDHTSKWNMDILLSVDKEIPGAENVQLSGTFFCKVFEGPFQNTSRWCNDYKTIAQQRGLSIKMLLMWYTTCPKCAKKYGKNYVAIVSQVEQVRKEI